ncbi:MAG: argininosuccinate synthase [Dehalococcoidia bacterium]|nr:argininosuccinate synthase [Dehalococcoidia bacterium]
MTQRDKVVLAYSGGLDTSVAIKWIAENYDLDVIALTIDVGNQRDLAMIREKALKTGAVKAIVLDARELFVNYFIFPALQADAMYEGEYPLATALSRPLIAKLMVDVAREEGASAVAHGCTGKGNDQVRLDVGVAALGPDLKIIAPVREWKMSREDEIEYAEKHGIPVPTTIASPYSTDENLWGRSVECGVLEDPWAEPPEEVYKWTRAPKDCPSTPAYLEVEFEKGLPVALDGERLDGFSLISRVNDIACANGVGRIDHIENRLVGIKSREIYECPAAMVLLKAHKALEDMTLSKDQSRFKQMVVQQYADLIYNGLWFSALHQDLAVYVQSTQRFVTGVIRLRLLKGECAVVGRKSPYSLYSHALATYDKADQFDHSASVGFIHLWGLPLKTQAQAQLLVQPGEQMNILPPKVKLTEE